MLMVEFIINIFLNLPFAALHKIKKKHPCLLILSYKLFREQIWLLRHFSSLTLLRKSVKKIMLHIFT